MNLILHLAGSIVFLFCFFYFNTHTEEHPSFVYLQYASLLIVFYFLMLGIKYWTSGRPPSMSYKQQQDIRLAKWHKQKAERRSHRRF